MLYVAELPPGYVLTGGCVVENRASEPKMLVWFSVSIKVVGVPFAGVHLPTLALAEALPEDEPSVYSIGSF